MKTIYLVRHAKSSWSNLELADHDRPLNDRGKRDAPIMATVLRGKGVTPDLFVSSTAKRARRTARKFTRAYGLAKSDLIKTPELYHASIREITRVIKALPEEASTVVLFGHNPGFTDFANAIQGSYIENVPTCGIVGLTSEIDNWRDFTTDRAKRVAFYYPKMFV
ncbi:phosphohistidine phosphatase [Lewinellaceae bacterium SD302]|nr:phosphohistidine phosphatase [Lewinellaceae bacterium SD302]